MENEIMKNHEFACMHDGFMKKIKIKIFHDMGTKKRFKYFSNRNKFDFVRTANRENKK